MGLFSCFGTLFGSKKSKVHSTSKQKIGELVLQEFIDHFNTIYKPIFIDNKLLEINHRIRNFRKHLEKCCRMYDEKKNLHDALNNLYWDEVEALQKILPTTILSTEPTSYNKLRYAEENNFKKIAFSETEIKEIRTLIKDTYNTRYNNTNSILALPYAILSPKTYPFAELDEDEFEEFFPYLRIFSQDPEWSQNSNFESCRKKILGITNFNNSNYHKQLTFNEEEKKLWETIAVDYTEKKEQALQLPALHTALLKPHTGSTNIVRTTQYTIHILDALLVSEKTAAKTACNTLTDTLIAGYGYSSVHVPHFATLLEKLSIQFSIDHASNFKITDENQSASQKLTWDLFPSESIKTALTDDNTYSEVCSTPSRQSSLPSSPFTPKIIPNTPRTPKTPTPSEAGTSFMCPSDRMPTEEPLKVEALKNSEKLQATLNKVAKSEKKIQDSNGVLKGFFIDMLNKATEQFVRYFSGLTRFGISKDITNSHILLLKLEAYCGDNTYADLNTPKNKDEYRLKTAQYALNLLQSLQSLASSPDAQMHTYLQNMMSTMVQGHAIAQKHLGALSHYRKGESGFASAISSTCQIFSDNEEIQDKVKEALKQPMGIKADNPLKDQIVTSHDHLKKLIMNPMESLTQQRTLSRQGS